jgi:hypothetical protein
MKDVSLASEVAENGPEKNNKKSRDILSEARSRLKMAISAFSDSREDELDDLRFYAGSPDNNWQWPADVLATRGSVQGQTINARPTLTINKLPQHVHQVTNEQRMNRPGIKVIPADDQAQNEVAEIFNGVIRHIEYISDADVAYDTACENQVSYGEGYIRLLTEYCDDNTFDQDIKIGRVRNSFSVYMDPMIQDPTGADARWCFITEDLTKQEYERLYPDAAPISTLMSLGVGDQSITQWIGENTVRIAEYFYVEHEKKTLNLYPGNVTAFQGTPDDKQLRLMFGKPLRQRDSSIRKIKWCKINGYEILEENEWAGKYIPVVRVIGNEFEVDGRMYISGLVRNAKDAQRMYNYWLSQEAEMLALAPKAPFIGYGGQFEGYETQWKTANTTNWPYLEVNPDVTDGNGAVLPLPARAQPPMASSGLLQAKMGAADDIKAATGQYNAALGMTSNERSGKAIVARQRQGDIGTFHYVDNLARAIRHVGRQLVDLIPKIYDTQRVARIIGEDGESSTVKINPMQQEPVKQIVDQNGVVLEKLYNPAVGKYDVKVITGPGYATKRQEALESMAQLLQGNPQLWQVAGDLFVKNMDWPGADELAARLASTIDPKILNANKEEDPALQAANMQIEQMGQEMEQMHQMLKGVQQSMEARELQIKEFEAQVKAYDSETKRISAVQAGMTPEQIQDIVMGTIAAALDTGDLVAGSPQMPPPEMPVGAEMGGMMAPQGMPPEMMAPQGVPPEMMGGQEDML